MVRRLAVIAALVACVAAAPTEAANISFATGGSNFNTAALTGYQTQGQDMGGMIVTASMRLATGELVSVDRTWADLGTGDWGVNFGIRGFDLTLGASTDTYAGSWQFSFFNINDDLGFKIESLAFNGGPGKTVFDRTFGSEYGTPDSYLGHDLSGFAGYQGNIRVDYLNAVGVAGAAPVGDIYRNVVFNFLSDGGLSAGEYSFVMDADNATTDIIPDNPVPEPASMVLLGTGLLGLVRATRKRSTR